MSQDKRSMKRKEEMRRFLLIGVTLLLCAATVFSVFEAICCFMKVKTFEIVGMSRYEKEDIVSASGVKTGSYLYSLDKHAIEEKILLNCPYLETVSVQAKFPNRLRIAVEGKDPQWYLAIAGSCYALDSNLVVIAETANTDGITKLILPHVQRAVYGEVPLFADTETERKKTLEVISAIRNMAFKERLTEVNLESRWDIRLVVDGKYDVLMGDMNDFDAKLKSVEAFLKQNSVSSWGEGTITLTKGTGGYVGAFSSKRTNGVSAE